MFETSSNHEIKLSLDNFMTYANKVFATFPGYFQSFTWLPRASIHCQFLNYNSCYTLCFSSLAVYFQLHILYYHTLPQTSCVFDGQPVGHLLTPTMSINFIAKIPFAMYPHPFHTHCIKFSCNNFFPIELSFLNWFQLYQGILILIYSLFNEQH